MDEGVAGTRKRLNLDVWGPTRAGGCGSSGVKGPLGEAIVLLHRRLGRDHEKRPRQRQTGMV